MSDITILWLVWVNEDSSCDILGKYNSFAWVLFITGYQKLQPEKFDTEHEQISTRYRICHSLVLQCSRSVSGTLILHTNLPGAHYGQSLYIGQLHSLSSRKWLNWVVIRINTNACGSFLHSIICTSKLTEKTCLVFKSILRILHFLDFGCVLV